MKKRRRFGVIFTAIFLAFVLACLALTASSYGYLPKDFPSWETLFGAQKSKSVSTVSNGAHSAANGQSQVHFVDCGQGDCEVIISGGTVTVIDAGPQSNAQKTYEYIKNLGVEKIDNLVLTHAHEDHIGGAKMLVDNFEIGRIYMSKPKSGTEPTTAVYRNLLQSIKDKGLKITTAKAGMNFQSGDFDMKIISPSVEYDELNNQSVVIHAVCGDTAFMFMGDAEKEPIADMIKNYPDDLKCDVLKVGHHGSKTSTTAEWLKKLNAGYAVISCADGNKYGHPHGAVLKLLGNADVNVYRTDLSGSIVIATDGKTVSEPIVERN